MGALTDIEIRKCIEDGKILIDPFDENNIGTTSLDLRLGEYVFRPTGLDPGEILNPYDEDSIRNHFGDPEPALDYARWLKETQSAPLANFKDGDRIFIFEPGEWILGVLMETIHLEPPLSAKLLTRSTLGRLGQEIWNDTGWIDPGFYGAIGVPISNHSGRRFVIKAGERIAQAIFDRAEGEIDRAYRSIGNYGVDLHQIASIAWKPEAIVPRPLRPRPGQC